MSYYWEILDKQTGEIKQYDRPFDYEVDAVEYAKNLIKVVGKPGTYIIKVFTQSPNERWPATSVSEPISSEEFFLQDVDKDWVVTFSGSVSILAKTAEEAIEKAKKVEAGAAGYGFRAGDF